MTTLDELAIKYNTDKSSLGHDYCRHYDALFANHLHWASILEFGVENGNSLRMWKEYCPWTRVDGVDLEFNPVTCRDLMGHIWVGDQQDIKFLQEYVIHLGPFNLIVDDASHRPEFQITTFSIMWPEVSSGGFYAIEDLQAGLFPEYNFGGPSLYPWLGDQIKKLHSSDLLGKVPYPGDIDMIYFTNDLVIFRKK